MLDFLEAATSLTENRSKPAATAPTAAASASAGTDHVRNELYRRNEARLLALQKACEEQEQVRAQGFSPHAYHIPPRRRPASVALAG